MNSPSRDTPADDALRAAAGQAFEADRGFLWGLSYRLLGSAADADDVVQETFLRALARPPADRTRAWRPWLVRVALNVGRDALRRRRRRCYEGPWLPGVLETGAGEPASFEPADAQGSPAARYDQIESLSLAFLLALEALTPTQRAVLLLRDVCDASVRETATALDMSEGNVKVTHLRARRALRGYDAQRRPPNSARRAQAAQALERFLTCVGQGDAVGLQALLAEDVRALSDGGGEYVAALQPVRGRDKVARFMLGLAARFPAGVQVEWRECNGLPAALLYTRPSDPRWAARSVFQLLLDEDGRVAQVLAILATRKLSALR
jgi:RNA polymerase sigma-70 factor (ECF subfamily)